jgi:hypothetical protein
MKFNDLDGDGVKDAGEPGLDGWVIHLFIANKSVHQTYTTAGGGLYSFSVPAGTYTICEQLVVSVPPWVQTFPTAGPGVVNCAATVDTPVDNPTPGPLGYTVEVTAGTGCGGGQQITGKDFGNIQLATKSGTKWNDVNGDHDRDLPGDVGLDGWVIHLYGTAVNGSAVHQTFTTAGGGAYSFTVLPGNYTVCEALQANWTQTFPVAGPGIVACTAAGDPAADNPTPGPLGYAITLTGGETESGNDFGNNTTTVFCNKQPVLTQLGGKVPDLIVRTDLGQPIQAAVNGVTDSNGDGYLIVGVVNNGTGALGGHVYNQSVVVSNAYDKPFWLIGCSVTLHDPTPGDGNAVIQIAASASSPGPYNIFLMDLHAADSAYAGIESTGDGRYLRNENVLSNAFGFKVTGNNNTIHNGSATSNGVGVWVSGNGNTVTDTNAYSNTSHGVEVIGNSNKLLKIDSGDSGKGNGGDGFNVTGDSNLLSEDDAFANRGNGFKVTGNSNTILKGRSGDSGKGNGTAVTLGDGYNVTGFGNAFQESRASANKGDGWDVSGGVNGSPNKFKSILSNTGSSGSLTLENVGPEYRLLGYVQNNGNGNKADNVTIPAAAKCPAFPTSPNTANVNFSCGD